MFVVNTTVLVLEKYGTKYNATPAGLHSKTGCVESGTHMLRIIIEQFINDDEYYCGGLTVRGVKSSSPG